MNENLDLTKILKDCPKGKKLYSAVYGEVEFVGIVEGSYYPIICHRKNIDLKRLTHTACGRLFDKYSGDCVLFPSKTQRDWSKFTIQKKHKEDLPKGTIVICTDTKNDICYGAYIEKGFVKHLRGTDCAWNYVIKMEPYHIGRKIQEIEITDDNNYGTLYWNEF